MRWPSTKDPLVEPRSVAITPVGGDAKFEVAARYAGVIDDDVGFGAATDDGDGFGEEPLVAVDVDDGVFGGRGRGRGGGGGSAPVFGVDLEGSAGFGGVGDEFDGDGAEEGVAVGGGVFGGLLGGIRRRGRRGMLRAR